MIYIIVMLYVLGSFMAYIFLKQEPIAKLEKIVWTCFWPFLTLYALCFGIGIWVCQKIASKIRKF